MAIDSSRIYNHTIKYSVTCLLMSILLLFCILFQIKNHSLHHFNFFQTPSEIEYFVSNQSTSSLTYHMEQTRFYPHLPIQIYTINREKFLKLNNKTKKIILLATPWFGFKKWTMESLTNGTNSGNMSEIYCSFLNNYCEITNDLTRYKQAHAVVYHLRDIIDQSSEIVKYRQPSQRFVFTLWEPPKNTPDLRPYNNFFNWTMTYRYDSHIFAPYYSGDAYRLKAYEYSKSIISDYRPDQEKIVLHENINTNEKIGTAAVLMSNCGAKNNRRWLIIVELQKYINVTVYGYCGRPCPTSSDKKRENCRKYIADHYYFYLAFENSYCQDYATEKFFATIMLPIIPVVFGQVDYSRYIPQSGFIDVRKFSTIADLGHRLNQIRNNLKLYQEYFRWKKDFVWGGFSHFMTPFCDLCLRLHLDTTPNIVENPNQLWFKKTCKPEVTQYFT